MKGPATGPRTITRAALLVLIREAFGVDPALVTAVRIDPEEAEVDVWVLEGQAIDTLRFRVTR